MLARSLLIAACLWATILGAAQADLADDQYRVASRHYQSRRWKLAAEEFRAFLTAHPDDERARSARLYRAESLVQLRDLPAAAVEFRAITRDPRRDDIQRRALFRAGEVDYLAGNFAEATRDLTAFAADYPADELNAFAGPYLGEMALARRDAEAAAKTFRQALERFPNGDLAEDCRYGLARSAELAGDHDLAQRQYTALAEPAGRRAADALYRLAALHYGAADYRGACAALESLERRFPDSPLRSRARLARARALFRLNELEAARSLLETLLRDETAPDSAEVNYWLGRVQQASQQWQAAAAAFESAATAATDPQVEAECRFHAAEALANAGQLEPAKQGFLRVAREFPGTTWAANSRLGLLRLLAAQGDHEALEKDVASFHSDAPDAALAGEADRLLARSLLARGQATEAARVMTPLVNQEDARRPQAENRLLLARAQLQQGRGDEALDTIEPVLKIAEGETRAQLEATRGAALATLGRQAEAVAALEASLAAHPDAQARPHLLAELALCYAGLGQFDSAQTTYRELQARRPPRDLLLLTCDHLCPLALAGGRYAWSAELASLLVERGSPPAVTARGLLALGWAQFKSDQKREAAATLARLLDEFPDEPPAAEGAVLRGRVLEAIDEGDLALATYHHAIDKYPESDQLFPALLAAARLHERLGQSREALELYQRLAKEFPDSPRIDAVLYQWAWAARSAGQDEQAILLFQRLHAERPESPLWADATYRVAEAALRGKQFEQAAALVAEILAAGAPGDVLQHALYLQAQTALAREQWNDVAPPLLRLLDEFPNCPLAQQAEYWIAEADYRRGAYAEAGQRLARLAEKPSLQNASWGPLVLLRQAQVLAQQSNWKAAAELAARVEGSYPDFDQQYEVDYLLGRALASEARFDEARQRYVRVVRSQQGERTETAAMAQWMIGESYMHQKEYGAALREYLRVEILYPYPKWQAAALLQAAKCHEFLDEPSEAAALYDRLLADYPATSFREEAAARREKLR